VIASIYACVRQYRKMAGVLRRALSVDVSPLMAYLDDEPQGDDQSKGESRKKGNFPDGVECTEEI
jgi:hypothetical protein